MIYEIRVYEASKGNEERLRRRFVEELASRFFPRHGIEVVGVFVNPIEDGKLTFLTRFEDEANRIKAWAAFASDADWKKVQVATERDGPLLHGQTVSLLSPTVRGLILD